MHFSTHLPLRRLALTFLALAASLTCRGAAVELSEKEVQQRLGAEGGALAAMINKIETTVTAGDAAYLASLIDADQVLEQATSGFKGTDIAMIRDVFCDGTKRAWIDNNPAKDYAGTSFRFLRPRTFQNRGGLLFRSESESGALNYYLFVLSDINAGGLRIRDIFTVGLNEFTSQTLRRTFSHLLASFAPEGGNESPLGKAYVEHLQKIADLNRAMREGKYAQALGIWEALPANVSHERSVLMMRVDAAERISPEDRVVAMADWLKTFPDEMDLPLKVADYYMAENRWEDAERILRQIMEAVGGDSRMLFQVGQIAHKRQQNSSRMWVNGAAMDATPANAREKAASAEKP